MDVHPAGRLHRAFRAPIPGLAERDLDLNVLRDHVAGSVVARRRVGRLEPGTVLHLYTQSIGSSAHRSCCATTPPSSAPMPRCLQSARLLPFREPTRHTDRVTRIERRIERRVLDAATLLVAQSEWAAELAARRLRHRRRSHPDRAVRHPAWASDRTWPSADPPIITWTGRSLERKGGARLLRIWRERLSTRTPACA